MKEYTIAINEVKVGEPKKVFKIVTYKAGGFAVLTPYHKEKTGFLMKHPIDYSTPAGSTMYVRFEDCVKYSVNNKVKLSFHPDGFVQFSGEVQGKVLSGRNKETGEIK